MQNSISAMKASAGEKQSRIKELDELLRMAQYYVDGKPVADKLGSIRFEKSRQKYKSEHDDTLRTFYMDQLSFLILLSAAFNCCTSAGVMDFATCFRMERKDVRAI